MIKNNLSRKTEYLIKKIDSLGRINIAIYDL